MQPLFRESVTVEDRSEGTGKAPRKLAVERLPGINQVGPPGPSVIRDD